MKTMLTLLVRLFRKAEGFSYDVLNGEMNPESGYMVSIEGFELKLNLSDMSDEDMAEAFDHYLKREDVSNALFNASGGIFFGAWKEGNDIVLDLSVHFDDLETAVKFGKSNNQRAIYDCAAKNSLPL